MCNSSNRDKVQCYNWARKMVTRGILNKNKKDDWSFTNEGNRINPEANLAMPEITKINKIVSMNGIVQVFIKTAPSPAPKKIPIPINTL